MDDSQTRTFKDSWPLDEKETEALMDFLPIQSQFFKNEEDFDSELKNDDVAIEAAEEGPKQILTMHETSTMSNGESEQKVMTINWNFEASVIPPPEIPSKEKSRRWIYADKPNDTDYLDIECRNTGKWLLFLDIIHRCEETGMTLHDYAWHYINELVKNGILFDAKCSTAFKGVNETYDKSQEGVICCYTPDYTDKQDVKRAADAIRKTVHYPCCMYYKTDNSTGAGKFVHTGEKHISTYKHTADRKMYERDLIIKSRWNLVDV